jgi:putative tryptophan/tyrosine transport system substrate-binding protein
VIDRRVFGLGLGALPLLPVTAHARAKGKIGYLHPVTISPSHIHITFSILKQAWERLGYQEGETVFARSGAGDAQLLPELVTELIAQGVGVLIVVGADAVRAAARTTKAVPIVAIDMETDPVQTGLITSYARPGGNVTGLFLDLPSLATKWIELMREAVPRLERIVFAWQPSTGRGQLDIALRAAQAMQIEAVILEIEPSVDFASKFSRLASAKPTGIVQLTLPGGSIVVASYAAATERHGLPSITFSRASAKAGSLMSYGPSQEAYFPRAVEIADRILGGDKVGEIPIERPFKFEFVINLKTARTLGLTIPPTLLARADEVIE